MKKCPYCAEEIQDEAIVCRYCGRDLSKPIAPQSPSPVSASRPAVPTPTKSRSNNAILIGVGAVAGLVLIILLCGLFSPRGGGAAEKACVSVDVFYCSGDGSFSEVKGKVTNTCSHALRYIKVVSEVYSESGALLDSDPEYVENIAPSESRTFESPMRDPGGQVTNCKAHVEEASR